MNRELAPAAVALHLEELRRLYCSESIEEGQRRHARPAQHVPFAEAVARRLGELRALLELTRRLHEASAELRRGGERP